MIMILNEGFIGLAHRLEDETGISGSLSKDRGVYEFTLPDGSNADLYDYGGDIIWSPESSGYTRLHREDYDSDDDFIEDIRWELNL